LSEKSKNEIILSKNLKINFLGGWGLKTPKITKNLPKLGHYLPFEQKIQK